MSHEFEIKPPSKINIGIKELIEYKELFYFFSWRDIKVKYKQTVLGFLWVILQPLFMTLIFTFFLGESIVEKTKLNIPYTLFALSGMLLWGVFSSGVLNSSNSMLNNAHIIKKIYFPRLIIPISSILVALVDFLVTFFVFIILLFIYRAEINYFALILVPFSVLIICLAAMGCGSFLAALNIKYRDVRYVIPFIIQGLLFLSPVLYPINMSNNVVLEFLFKINPVSGALELIRGIFSGYDINYNLVFTSSVSSILLFIMGVIYFKKTESYFADIV